MAERMLRDYDAHRPNEIFAERGIDWLTVDDAYAVQRAVAELRQARGERCLGYKVGCLSPTIQKQLGLNHPVRGYLWQKERHRTGVRLCAADYSNLAVEGEIAVRVSSELPAEAAQASWRELGNCFECWFPVIELHHHVFRGEEPTPEELVAGNAMHAGFVAPSLIRPCDFAQGDPVSIEQLVDAEIRVQINRTVLQEAKVSSLPGGALGSVRWLVSSLALCQETLKPGDIVLTGSPGRLIPVRPGNAITVACAGRRVELFVT